LLALLAVSVALVAQGVPTPVAAAARGAAPTVAHKSLPAPRIVDVRTFAKRGRHSSTHPSWLQTPTLPSPGGGGKYSSAFSGGGGINPSTASGPQAVEAATLFAGLSLAQNEQLYGQDQDVEPADAQIGASPSWLVEIAGNTMALFSPDGSLQWTVDLRALFQLPAGYFFYAPSSSTTGGAGGGSSAASRATPVPIPRGFSWRCRERPTRSGRGP